MATNVVKSEFAEANPTRAYAGPAQLEGPNARFTTQQFVRDVLFSNIPVPFQKLRSYLWLAFMTRALGADGFGAWSIFILALSNATTFGTLNCGSSMMRFLSGRRGAPEVNQAFSTVLAMVGVAVSVVVVLLFLFSSRVTLFLFRSPHALILTILLAVALPLDCAYEEMKNLLRARRLNQSWAFFSLSRLLPEIGATLAVAWWLRSVELVSWTYVAIGALSVAGGLAYLAFRHDVSFARPSIHVAVRYAKFGLPLLPGVLASAISLGSDKYLVGYYLGLTQVGIYSVCFTISALTFFLIGPINDVLFPELSALHDSGDIESFRRRFAGIQKFVLGFSIGGAAILATFPQQVLRLLASQEFISGSTTLALLGVQGVFMAFVMLYAVILNVRLRVWSSTAFWLASGALILFLDVVLIPRIGIEGAAVSQLIATAGGAIVLIAIHWDLFSRTFEPKWLIHNGIAFVAVCLLPLVWQEASPDSWHSTLKIATGFSIFLLCLFITGFIRLDGIRTMKGVATL
ncbi:MAG TPA: oligosaccharide flippase family protein [Candidatus Acidoferrales bacterium]|nr:oligosaccharide flippase family protein [Candidatus Acidoferrales bacterium]